MEEISICTIGDSTCDNFYTLDEDQARLMCNLKHQECEISFKYGEKIPVRDTLRSFGGSALNTAIGFSRLGLETSIFTILGKDEEGEKAKKFLENNSVGVDGVVFEGKTNQAAIILYQGERTIFSYHAPRNYANLNSAEATWIYFASASEGSDKYMQEAMTKNRSSKIAFNPGSWQLANFDKFTGMISLCEVLILNKSEADMILQKESQVAKQLEKMLSMGIVIPVITDGANGAYSVDHGKILHMGTLATKAIDPTGAGDSFASGFVSALAHKLSIEESMKWGMVNSGHVVETTGANSALLRYETMKSEVQNASNLKATEL